MAKERFEKKNGKFYEHGVELTDEALLGELNKGNPTRSCLECLHVTVCRHKQAVFDFAAALPGEALNMGTVYDAVGNACALWKASDE